MADPPERFAIIDYTFDTDPIELQTQTGTDKNDDLFGTGRDRLLGQGGDDLLFATGGRDYLEGGGGNDLLYGNYGIDDRDEDHFVFGRDDGIDAIFDFVPPSQIAYAIDPPFEQDKIVLLGGTPKDITEVVKGAVASPDGDVELHYGDTTIRVEGVAGKDVAEDWFLIQ